MAKYCMFCGNKPQDKNKEHIIPRWLIANNNLTITPEIPAKQGISEQKGVNNYCDKNFIHPPRQNYKNKIKQSLICCRK